MLSNRITTLQQIKMNEFLKDIEEREMANINDIQLGDEDRISKMPVSAECALKPCRMA
jgi:hypothetical protein